MAWRLPSMGLLRTRPVPCGSWPTVILAHGPRPRRLRSTWPAYAMTLPRCSRMAYPKSPAASMKSLLLRPAQAVALVFALTLTLALGALTLSTWFDLKRVETIRARVNRTHLLQESEMLLDGGATARRQRRRRTAGGQSRQSAFAPCAVAGARRTNRNLHAREDGRAGWFAGAGAEPAGARRSPAPKPC